MITFLSVSGNEEVAATLKLAKEGANRWKFLF